MVAGGRWRVEGRLEWASACENRGIERTNPGCGVVGDCAKAKGKEKGKMGAGQQGARFRLQDVAGQNTRWRFVLVSGCAHAGFDGVRLLPFSFCLVERRRVRQAFVDLNEATAERSLPGPRSWACANGAKN